MIGWDPMDYTVSTTSVMIVPPVRPNPSGIGTWAATTAYTVGEIVENGDHVYWCVGAGTSAGSGGPTQTDGDATDGTVTWRYLRPMRWYLSIVNSGAQPVFLAFDNAAEVNHGTRLNAAGGALTLTGRDCPQGAVYAIAGSGSNVVTIQEG